MLKHQCHHCRPDASWTNCYYFFVFWDSVYRLRDLPKGNVFTIINVPVHELIWFSHIQQKDFSIEFALIQFMLKIICRNSGVKCSSLFPLPGSKSTLQVSCLKTCFVSCHLSHFLGVIFVFSN